MEHTYLGILRGKMMPMDFSATMLLKGAEDKIFFLETKLMSGYTTRMTIKNVLSTMLEQEPDNPQLHLLLEEMKGIRIDQEEANAAANVEQGQPILDWLGI